MSRPLFVKVNNAWREGTSYIKVGGSWKQVTELGVKIAGSWKSGGEPHTTHVFDRQVVSPQYEIFPPRCIEDGLYYYSCSCGLSSAGNTGATFYVPATGGDYNYFPLQYITSDLTHAKKCQQCGGPHELEHHVVSNWTQTVVSGTIVQLTGTCSVCGATAKHTHDTSSTQNCEYCDLTVECQHLNTEVMAGQDASCTTTGSTDGLKCANCGKVLRSPTIIPAKGHDFSSTWLYNVSRQRVSPATCTSDAVYTKECTRCVAQSTSTFTASEASGGSGLEYALGHNLTEDSGIVTIPATCQASALHFAKCSRCNYVSYNTSDGIHVGNIDPYNHYNTEYCAEVPATCTSTGREAGYKCTACDAWASGGAVIKKLDHSFSHYTAWEYPGDGGDWHYRYKICSRCNEPYEEEGEACNVVFMRTTDATCQDLARGNMTCSVCGEVYEEDVEEPGGSYGSHAYASTGTYRSNGDGTHSMLGQCICGETKLGARKINCSGGTATCTYGAICAQCKTEYEPSLGHIWIRGNALDVRYGRYYFTCNRCNVTAIGNNFCDPDGAPVQV